MKKDILLVINTLGRAGAENAMLALINKLDKKQVNVDVFVLLNQGEMALELPEWVNLLNKKYCNESVLSSKGKKYLIKNTLKACFGYASILKNIPFLISNTVKNIRSHRRIQPDKLLWRVISDGSKRFNKEYDLAISYIEGGSAYYVCDHVKAKKKAAFIHIDYGQAGYTRSLDRDCYLKFDRIFTVSDEVRQHFLEYYKESDNKTFVLHNLLNEEKIKAKADMNCEWPKEWNNDCKKLVTIGRLTYQKGYDVAIEAMKILKDAGMNICWLILGDGPEKKNLTDKVKNLGLEDVFIMPGSVSNPYPYLKNCDIYVHATRFEGKSIAIQEAQILAKPIIASDCSGNREQIISGTDGILCEFDAGHIADAVRKMLKDEQLLVNCGRNAGLKKINHLEELQLLYELIE